MTLDRPTVVVLGIMCRRPVAGVTWQILHYLEGLRRIGCDVYYLEDTGAWPYDPERGSVAKVPDFVLEYLSRAMARCGLTAQWAYRSGADGAVFGLSAAELERVLARADALINVTGSTRLREHHLRIPLRIYVETDPGLGQLHIARGVQDTINQRDAHTHLATFGENFASAECEIPLGRFRYLPTRQPVVVDWWLPEPGAVPASGRRFTTITSWDQTGRKDVEWNGATYYWSKHQEFLKFIDLPSRFDASFEMALASKDPEVIDMLAAHGWIVTEASGLSDNILAYRDYIRGSGAEFTVAKDQYIRLRTGWFSDRSACYLAAGRPVVTQDTAFGHVLPTGEGLFAFDTMADIVTAADSIVRDYRRHSAAARGIAEEYFRAERVVANLLDRAGIPVG